MYDSIDYSTSEPIIEAGYYWGDPRFRRYVESYIRYCNEHHLELADDLEDEDRFSMWLGQRAQQGKAISPRLEAAIRYELRKHGFKINSPRESRIDKSGTDGVKGTSVSSPAGSDREPHELEGGVCPECGSTECKVAEDGTCECMECGAHFPMQDDTYPSGTGIDLQPERDSVEGPQTYEAFEDPKFGPPPTPMSRPIYRGVGVLSRISPELHKHVIAGGATASCSYCGRGYGHPFNDYAITQHLQMYHPEKFNENDDPLLNDVADFLAEVDHTYDEHCGICHQSRKGDYVPRGDLRGQKKFDYYNKPMESEGRPDKCPQCGSTNVYYPEPDTEAGLSKFVKCLDCGYTWPFKFIHFYGKQSEEYIREVAPPGREEQVKALKKVPGIDNPWAVAWASYNKSRKKKKHESSESELLSQVEDFLSEVDKPSLEHGSTTVEPSKKFGVIKPKRIHRHLVKTGIDARKTNESIDLDEDEEVVGDTTKRVDIFDPNLDRSEPSSSYEDLQRLTTIYGKLLPEIHLIMTTTFNEHPVERNALNELYDAIEGCHQELNALVASASRNPNADYSREVKYYSSILRDIESALSPFEGE